MSSPVGAAPPTSPFADVPSGIRRPPTNNTTTSPTVCYDGSEDRITRERKEARAKDLRERVQVPSVKIRFGKYVREMNCEELVKYLEDIAPEKAVEAVYQGNVSGADWAWALSTQESIKMLKEVTGDIGVFQMARLVRDAHPVDSVRATTAHNSPQLPTLSHRLPQFATTFQGAKLWHHNLPQFTTMFYWNSNEFKRLIDISTICHNWPQFLLVSELWHNCGTTICHNSRQLRMRMAHHKCYQVPIL